MFQLDREFVNSYRDRPVSFGFNGVGELAYFRTYSRDDNPFVNGTETWVDTCERCINGMFTLLREALPASKWSDEKAQEEAKEAFDLMFDMKWTPPGRGLTVLGTPFLHERGVIEATNNCAFISTKDIEEEGGEIFGWFMEMLMLGVGVGSDTRGINVKVYRPAKEEIVFEVPDTREGWAKSLELLINSYLIYNSPTIKFDYSKVRPAGMRINGFGGVSSGPGPLEKLHEQVRSVLDRPGDKLTSRQLVDIFNMIGACVVAGNVRRSAEIMLGYPTDMEFLTLKNYSLNPDRVEFGWSSNNSVFAYRGQNYDPITQMTWDNGEPGFFWMENIHTYGRMGHEMTGDEGALGGNPCGEQPLWDRELCTLVEVHLPRIKDKLELRRVMKYAYMYGKAIVSGSRLITNPKSRAIMEQNRRMGISMTGISQFVESAGLESYMDWAESAYHWVRDYDKTYSHWMGINESVRITTVKPSGTVALLSGVTPGVHYGVADRFHIRRVTLQGNSPLVDVALAAGYPVETLKYDSNSVAVEFPVDSGPHVKSVKQVTPMRQLEVAYAAAKYYSDNAVSLTVQFDPTRYGPEHLSKWVQESESKLKTVSFLPIDNNSYEQMPYESISEDEYNRRIAKVKPMIVDTSRSFRDMVDAGCEGVACEIGS